MNYKDVELEQRSILKEIKNCSDPRDETKPSGLLVEIERYSDSEASYALGDFGRNLKSFVKTVDLTHPDVSLLFDGHLVSNGEESFSKIATDLLKLAAFGCKSKFCSKVMTNLKKVVTRAAPNYKEINREVGDPFSTARLVRFMSCRKDRRKIRRGKIAQNVSEDLLLKKGMAFWDELPSNFNFCTRNANPYKEDVRKSTEQKSHFSGFGLTSMAAEIQRSIDHMEGAYEEETYYGFNKITMISAAIILAKMMGFKYEKLPTELVTSQIQMVCYWEGNFNGYPLVDKVAYEPMAYTNFDLPFSRRMNSLINFLDEFPEAGGKAIFDHYRVLVPTINYPNKFHSMPWVYKSLNKQEEAYWSYNAARRHFDRMLIENQMLFGVLLGEKDGELYFVNYWV